MNIHENLRQLRLNSGMTQEQAAERIGFTRQALSSYESGRTRPDIETLMRLAEVYGTDLEGVLYGQHRRLKAARRVKWLGTVFAAVLVLLSVVSAALPWLANRFYVVESGPVAAEEKAVLEARFRLLELWESADRLILGLAFWGCLLLLILLLTGGSVTAAGTKAAYVGVLSGALLAVAALAAATDPVYPFANYALTPVLVILRLWVFLLIDLGAERLQRRQK